MDIKNNVMSSKDIEELNKLVVFKHDEKSKVVDIDETLKNTGIRIVGAGRIDWDGNVYIEEAWEKIREYDSFLIEKGETYANLWARIDTPTDDAIDQQVRLHLMV